jgi:hypothetical protein
MKAKPFKFDGVSQYTPCEPKEASYLRLELPCDCRHLMLPVMVGGTRAGTPNWTWNGDCEKPTIKPSVRTRGADFVCHSWINDGVMQFLPDTASTNPTDGHVGLGGKSIPLLEIEE